MTKWYTLIIGVVLILVGLDPWLPTGPEVMVMPLAGVVSIIVGVIGLTLGGMELKGKKKAPSSTSPSA